MSKPRWLAFVALAASLHAARATAQPSREESARADALFAAGNKLFDAGRTHEACEKFAASMKLDPANGTLQNLALCHEKDHRTATAWREFTLLAERSAREGRRDRATLGAGHAAALSAVLSRVSLRVPAGTTVTDIRVDGAPLLRDEWPLPLPLDPGEHTIQFAGPAGKSDEKKLNVPDGPATTTLDAPLWGADASAAALAPRASPAPLGTRKIAALSLAGAGLVAAGFATYFGLHAQALGDDATRDGCSGSTCPSQAGVQASSASVGAGDASTVLFVAAGALVAGGAILWLTAPASKPSTNVGVAPVVGPRLATGSLVLHF